MLIFYIFFTGCLESQMSTDANIGGSYNGAFTYYFCKHVLDANTVFTRSEVLKRLRSALRFNKYDQIPQLECPAPKLKNKDTGIIFD